MIRLVHISDLHLCDEFSSSILETSELRQRQWQTLINVVNFANDKNCNFILISGDVYERNYFTENHAKRFVNILSKFNGYVLIIAGNHDYVGDSFPFDNIEVPENIIYHLSNKVRRYDFDECNISIFMHSWEKNFEFTPAIKNLEIKNKNNILMIHSGTNIDTEAIPFSDIDLDEKINYVALGHIHKPYSIGRFYYPGSLEPLSIKETGKHGGYYIEIDRDVKVNFINFASIEYFDYEIYCTDKTVDEITEELSKLEFRDVSVLRLKLIGDGINFEKKELEYSLKQYFNYVNIVDSREVSFNLIGIDSSLLSEIDKIVDNKFSEDYKNDLKRKIFSLITRANRL